jgi:azurin
MKKIQILWLSTLFMMSCSGGNEKKATSVTEKTEEIIAAQIPKIVKISIEGDDMMRYNLDKIEVNAGQTVELTLRHTGQMSALIMGHNWILLSLGTDKAAFGMAAMSAKEQGYVPQDMKENVLAATKIIGGGESTTITFDAPAPGYYEFICSFPGHYGLMNGSFIVLP